MRVVEDGAAAEVGNPPQVPGVLDHFLFDRPLDAVVVKIFQAAVMEHPEAGVQAQFVEDLQGQLGQGVELLAGEAALHVLQDAPQFGIHAHGLEGDLRRLAELFAHARGIAQLHFHPLEPRRQGFRADRQVHIVVGAGGEGADAVGFGTVGDQKEQRWPPRPLVQAGQLGGVIAAALVDQDQLAFIALLGAHLNAVLFQPGLPDAALLGGRNQADEKGWRLKDGTVAAAEVIVIPQVDS